MALRIGKMPMGDIGAPSWLSPIGRAGGIRTHGLFDPNEALYQAEPQPDYRRAD